MHLNANAQMPHNYTPCSSLYDPPMQLFNAISEVYINAGHAMRSMWVLERESYNLMFLLHFLGGSY